MKGLAIVWIAVVGWPVIGCVAEPAPTHDAATLGRVSADLEAASDENEERRILIREGFSSELAFRAAVEATMENPDSVALFAESYAKQRAH